MVSERAVVYGTRIALMVVLVLLSFIVFLWLTANGVIALVLTVLLSPFIVLTVAVGRFFCGWICPVGFRIRANEKSKYGKNFCRLVCPAGLVLSLFNKVSLIKLNRDIEKCTPAMCPIKNACTNQCPMGCDVLNRKFGDFRCVRCFKCIRVCSVRAIRGRWLWQK